MSNSGESIDNSLASDASHNRNCFNYLRNLRIAESVLAKLDTQLADNLRGLLVKTADEYDPNYPYADLYTYFFNYIDENINVIYPPKLTQQIGVELAVAEASISNMEGLLATESVEPMNVQLFKASIKNNKEKIAALQAKAVELDEWDSFVLSIYHNDNNILKETYEAIKYIPLQHNPLQPSIEHTITTKTRDRRNSVNRTAISPSMAGSDYERLATMLSSNFKSQHGTSLATKRQYRWNTQRDEIRIGTQGQRHQGAARVSPVYERYLESKARRLSDPQRITDIYFNNLGRDRSGFEGNKEKALTFELEGLENRHANIAVITLPADQGLMRRCAYKDTKPHRDYAEVKQEFLQIASQSTAATRAVKDFYISPSIRKRVFADANGRYGRAIEQAKLNDLISASFLTFGIVEGTQLSDAQQQAVWFHFTKFTLTDHIIETLNPQTINFSCKDAIDRGGVSSAYYNLLKSFQSSAPMNQDEFEEALHAAPTMVKGRGMNHHIHLIWNTVDSYITGNYNSLKNDPDKVWLIKWRDANCPHERIKGLLEYRINQLSTALNEAKRNNPVPSQMKAIDKALTILSLIKNQADMDVSGKRLLLEAAIQTTNLALKPSAEKVAAFNSLHKQLTINYPALHVIGGLMKALSGIALTILSMGLLTDKGLNLINKGMSTVKAGISSATRTQLQQEMKHQLLEIKVENLEAKETNDSSVKKN